MASRDRRAWPGLEKAPGTAGVAWFVDQMAGRQGVALAVPAGFAAHARILHPRVDGRRWSDAEPSALAAGPSETWGPDHWMSIDGGAGGALPPALADVLVPMLAAATGTPDSCHFGQWLGWGDFRADGGGVSFMGTTQDGRLRHRLRLWRAQRDVARRRRARRPIQALLESCPVYPWWGGRDMALLDGPLVAVRSVGTVSLVAEEAFERRSPQWWWPDDRSWFVATEIDDLWTYVAGPEALIEAVLAEDRWEATRVQPDDPW